MKKWDGIKFTQYEVDRITIKLANDDIDDHRFAELALNKLIIIKLRSQKKEPSVVWALSELA